MAALDGPWARRLPVLLVLALVAVGAFFVVRASGTPPKTVTAHFDRAVSLYVGSDVRILGVTVGKVTSVTPEGQSVRVDMTYDAKYDVPADAKAVVVTPTLVSDRFVQLTPVFAQGDDVMADGADIPLPDTAVPVELDQLYSTLKDLSTTLGPNGLNKDGTLNHLLEGGATALDGQGARLNQMITDLSQASKTFGDGSGDLFDTVSQLADVTTTLADNDQVVRTFTERLAGVSKQLSGERANLAALLKSLGSTVQIVESFVRKNRGALSGDLKKLTRVTRALASQRDSLDDALAVGPASLQNLLLLQDDLSRSVGARPGFRGNVASADQFLCSFVTQTDLPKVTKDLACAIFSAIIGPIQGPIINSPARAATGAAVRGASQSKVVTRKPTASGSPAGVTPASTPTLRDLIAGGAS
ncbi:MCE family protein [Nocardioides acrostichi]|uniref:MCE family protein n=1 Tax=Nocardioides acrostichi TaxID=2784339 RepID=A0A930UYN7_9ACTN|nr:MCE family protein [Nocardioides acrostichi]MBF4162147.1 MCE family protein [Nocardioides acrostichi]